MKKIRLTAILLILIFIFSSCFYVYEPEPEEPIRIKVYFDYDGGEGIGMSKTVTVGEKYGTLPVPEKAGYVFDGWYLLLDGGGNKVTEAHTVRYNVDHTIYAKWIKEFYTVSFDSAGGQCKTVPRTVTFNEKYGWLPRPVKDGYYFLGWQTEDGKLIKEYDRVEIVADHTLSAVWQQAQWVILNNFNYTSDSQINNAGITYKSRNNPKLFDIWGPYARVNTSSDYSKSGNSMHVILYADKPVVIYQNLDWRPSVKIPKSSFAAPYNTMSFADMLAIEMDIYYYTQESGNNHSSTLWSKCFIVLYSGNEALCHEYAEMDSGWNTIGIDLAHFSQSDLQRVDSIAVEFFNDYYGDPRRYRFYIDDLRAVMRPDS